MKDKIIYHLLIFIDTKRLEEKEKSLELLNELAKKYHIKLKNMNIKTDLYKILKDFILNEKGYNYILPILYFALKQSKTINK